MTIEPGAELRFAGATGDFASGRATTGILDARERPRRADHVHERIDSGDADLLATASTSTRAPTDRYSTTSSCRTAVESNGTGNVNFRIGSVVTIGVVTFSHSEDYAAVIDTTGLLRCSRDRPTDRVYELNGQGRIPGAGDPAFDCVREHRGRHLRSTLATVLAVTSGPHAKGPEVARLRSALLGSGPYVRRRGHLPEDVGGSRW